MKKLFSLITIVFTLLKVPAHTSSEAFSESQYSANEGYEKKESFDFISVHDLQSPTGMSMLGWGIGLAAVIAILSGVIHKSAEKTTQNN